MESKTEIWKPHPEYKEIEVSTMGNVRTLDKLVFGKGNGTYPVKGRILKQHKNNCGYLLVSIPISGRRPTKTVHRLVAQTFINNPQNLPQVNHKDGNRENNNVSNLEWCTASYNSKYREKFGNALSKPVCAINLATGKVLHFRSQYEASRVLGIQQPNINAVIKGKRKQTGCYLFENANAE